MRLDIMSQFICGRGSHLTVIAGLVLAIDCLHRQVRGSPGVVAKARMFYTRPAMTVRRGRDRRQYGAYQYFKQYGTKAPPSTPLPQAEGQQPRTPLRPQQAGPAYGPINALAVSPVRLLVSARVLHDGGLDQPEELTRSEWLVQDPGLGFQHLRIGVASHEHRGRRDAAPP